MDMCERDGLPIEKANKDPSTERTLLTFNLRLNTSMSQNCIITLHYITFIYICMYIIYLYIYICII